MASHSDDIRRPRPTHLTPGRRRNHRAAVPVKHKPAAGWQAKRGGSVELPEGYRMKIQIDHNGTTYYGVVMHIKSTMLGTEDHGIFTAYLNCEGAGTGVGVGGYALDVWDEGEKSRVGHAYGVDHIKAIMSTVGVSKWEAVPGRDVVVLHETESIWGSVASGIASLMGDRVLIFKEHYESVKARLDGAEVPA